MAIKSTANHGISVIMPVYNGGKYLKTAVKSILTQSYKNLELLLIDDHSTDRSINELERSDHRLKVITHTGKGIVSALNTGIEKATMPFIARMDADDIALPQRLAKQLEYLLHHPDIQICSTQVELFRDKCELGGGYRHYQQWINALKSSDDIARNIFIESPIPHPTVMMRKQVIIDLGGYQDNHWPEDYDLWLRAYVRGHKFGKPDGVLLRWRDHDTRLSRQSSCYNKNAFFKAKAYYLAHIYKRRQFRIWGSGPTGALLHDELNHHSAIVTDFIDVAPKRIGNKKRNKPIVNAYTLQKTSDLILVAVSARGARQDIKNYLDQNGYIETIDYLCAA